VGVGVGVAVLVGVGLDVGVGVGWNSSLAGSEQASVSAIQPRRTITRVIGRFTLVIIK
jgi:hypothetical protein